MLGILAALTALTAWASASTVIPTRDYATRNYFLVETNDATALHKFNYTFEHQMVGFDDHYVFSIDKTHPHNRFLGNLNSNNHNLIKRDGFEHEVDELTLALSAIHMLEPKRLERRLPVPCDDSDPKVKRAGDSSTSHLEKVAQELDIKDPIFKEQWHLVNSQYPGNDVNVTGLWYEGITGKGVVTAIVDDGLDYESHDLGDNFNLKGSWDFNDNRNNPFPSLDDDYHGTRCAGEVAAVRNDVCGVGVAYDSQVAGIRILSGSITAVEEAQAMMHGLDVNDIYSCSWGPTDDGRTLAQPEIIVKRAMVRAVQEGRQRKGSVYVFASGNGARFQDSCNMDGYTNSIYSITVGAVDHRGAHPVYSEACSAVMVVTYSAGLGEYIHTTDVKKQCTAIHGGTSAAAPLAAGIYALVLQANPDLTWRDVQYVSALSAVPINENDGDYQMTALGRKYSHRYGFGKIDAWRLAHLAQEWKNVNPQTWLYSDTSEVHQLTQVTANYNGLMRSNITITPDDVAVSNLKRVEHVTVLVNIGATFRGRVGVRLISPNNTVSELATFRPYDSSEQGFKDWTFMSVAHWGESGVGTWNLEVFGEKNAEANDIHFESWSIRLFGESADADKAEVYNITADYAMERRARLDDLKRPKSKSVSLSASLVTASSSAPASGSATASVTSETSAPASSSSAEEPGSRPGTGKNKHYTSDHTGQYFMALAVVGFIVVILVMKFHKTPTHRRRRRDEYEFDLIPGEDYSDSNDEDSLDLGRYDEHATQPQGSSESPESPPESSQESQASQEVPQEVFRIDDDDDKNDKTGEAQGEVLKGDILAAEEPGK